MEQEKKKRGRPRIHPIKPAQTEPKRRGRPPKILKEETIEEQVVPVEEVVVKKPPKKKSPLIDNPYRSLHIPDKEDEKLLHNKSTLYIIGWNKVKRHLTSSN